jgi:hypothetical protein
VRLVPGEEVQGVARRKEHESSADSLSLAVLKAQRLHFSGVVERKGAEAL